MEYSTIEMVCFDAPVRTVNSKKDKIYAHLLIQMDCGSCAPTKLVSNSIHLYSVARSH